MASSVEYRQPTPPVAKDSGPGTGIYIAFVPWVLFTLVTDQDTLIAGSVVALVAAVAIALPSLLKGRPKLLELAAVAAFADFTAIAVVADPSTGADVARYARAIAAAGLAMTAFGSLLFVSFTEQYARESVPRQYWSSPRFKHINRQLTAMWGWVFTAMIPSHLIAGAIDTHRANVIFNWLVPALLVMWSAKRTAAVTSDAKDA
jgi:hypothetical protein